MHRQIENCIDCTALNRNRGHVNCGASSFVGIDSFGKIRFCFLLDVFQFEMNVLCRY